MGIDPMNNISIIIRILFAVTLFQHLGSFSAVLKQQYKDTVIAKYGIESSLKQLKLQPLKISK
jgi:hypothetical protein